MSNGKATSTGHEHLVLHDFRILGGVGDQGRLVVGAALGGSFRDTAAAHDAGAGFMGSFNHVGDLLPVRL